MLIGHLVPLETITQLDTKRLDELTKLAMEEIIENPVIDDEIRRNPVIMKELAAVVGRSLKPYEVKTHEPRK